MIKIGFDAKRYFHNRTGLGNYSRDLVRILLNQPFQKEILLFDTKPINQPDHSDLKFIGPSQSGFKKKGALWRSLFIKKDLKLNPIHIYHGLSAELPLIDFHQCVSVVTIHDLIFLRFPQWYNPIDRFIYRLKMKNAIKKADHILCISEQTKKELIYFFPGFDLKIKVIYQSCHPLFQTGISNQLNQKEIISIEKKFEDTLPNRYILSVGTIEPRKNLLNAIKAIHKCNDSNIKLVVVGRKTDYFRSISRFIEEHNMQDQCIFLENVSIEELVFLYQKAEFSVYLSIYEGFGIPIIESLFSKTPVITNKNGVFKEAGGPGAKYVNINDLNEIELAIKELWNDTTLQNKLAEKGISFVQKFNDQAIGRELSDFYQEVVQQK